MLATILLITAAVVIAAVFIGAFCLLKFAVFRKEDKGTASDKVIRPTDSDEIKRRKQWYFDHSGSITEYEIVSLDGLKLKGFLLPACNASAKTVIFFHGYTSNHVQEGAIFHKFWHEHGFNVLAVDLRAHGESEGKYITYGVKDRKDAAEWVKLIIRLFGENSEIYFHGVSMGCATALMAAGENLPANVKGMVADCGYTTAYEQFCRVIRMWFHLPPIPLIPAANLLCGIICGWHFKECDTRKCLSLSEIPVLFIHGEKDGFIDKGMSVENYNACKGRKKLVLFQNADHAESFYKDPERYEREIEEFFGV